MTETPARRHVPSRSAGDVALLVAGLSIGLIYALLIAAEPRGLALLGIVPFLAVMILVLWRALSGDRRMIMVVLIASVFMIDAVFRVRSYSDKSIDFQIMMKVSTWALLTVIAMSRLSVMLSTILSGERLLWMVFLTWIMATTALAPNPVYAFVAGFSLVAFFLFFASITARFSLEDVLMAILAATVLLALVSLVVYVAVPSLGRSRVWVGNVQVISGRLAGIAGNANSIGRICCLGVIIIVLCWRRLAAFTRFLPWALMAILGLTLLLSNSRTSMLVALVVIGVHMLVRGRNLHILVGFLAAVFLLFLAVMPFSNDVLIALSRSGRADELATGTSRTLIWSVVTNLSWQRPLFGWGYGSSVFILPQYERFMGHAAPHAHNMILQLWFTTGFVGVVLFLVAIMSRLTLAVMRGERMIIALLLYVILNGLTESSAFGGIANITSVVLALAAVMREAPTAVGVRQVAEAAKRRGPQLRNP